ncbi:DEAD/DEAH box helicase, partial [Streptococcus suis]
ILQKLNEELYQVQAVITAPSRELSNQVYQAARQLASHTDIEVRVTNYVGGTDKYRQIDKLQASQPLIVVGTPGRIYELV